jgi:epoxide hydrolase-like predicted phosphatase
MAIRAIVFDIGGVLEITPNLGIDEKWETKLGLQLGTFNTRLHDIWHGGSIGTITEAEVHQGIAGIMGMSAEQVNAFMRDVWVEYLGTLNLELADYFRGLHTRFITGILSNSFVGAREREQAHYHFDEMTHDIIYSREVGLSKPDRRIYELTCQRLGVQPHEMIFLDNVQQAVDAACEVGIHGILFTDNIQAIADIEACIQDSR